MTKLAIKNTSRRKGRASITLITLALGVAIFSTGFNVRQAIKELLIESSAAMRYDVQVSFVESEPNDKIKSILDPVPGIRSIEAWSGGSGIIEGSQHDRYSETPIVALPFDTQLLKKEIVLGRWLSPSNNTNSNTNNGNEIVVNQKMFESLKNPEIGKTYILKTKSFAIPVTLAGVVKEFAQKKIYMDKARFNAIANPENRIKYLMITSDDKGLENVIKLEKEIEKALEKTNIGVRNVESQSELMKVLYDHLNIILAMLLSMALLVLVVASLGMASAMGINIMERTREIGIMRAIGATPKTIYKLFIFEGLITSLGGIILGLLISLPLSTHASQFFGSLIIEYPLPFALSFLGISITIVVTLIFGWFASRIPSLSAIKLSCRQALSYE